MMKHTCVALFLLASIGAALEAQEIVYHAFRAEQASAGVVVGPSDMDVIALDPLVVGRPVLNAPYSAEAVTEMTQVLADGNRIERRTSATIARDSRGRTRREQLGIILGRFVASSARPLVTITDPTTETHFTLNYDDKVAFRARSRPIDPDTVRARREAAQGATATMASRPAGQVGRTVIFEAPTTPEDPRGDPVAAAVAPESKTEEIVPVEGSVRTVTLEPRVIEGIRAEGSRTVLTIPADTMGNALAIEIVSERWYAPELGIVLLTRRLDPRFGETVYRVTNINRAEPPADLFSVPLDFKVKDVPLGKLTPIKPE
jgi:hypothetical protein